MTALAPFNFDFKTFILFSAVALGILFHATVDAQTQGFTEPFRTIELSSDETGAIAELMIDEGQRVEENAIIAKLDDRVQELQLEIAKQLANSKSQLLAAKRTLEKRQAIEKRLMQLRKKGHASESELIRSQMELSIAESKYLAAQEDQVVREIEQRRAEVQLERRNIRAPFAGVVSKVHRREGEFLSPLRPEIVTIVQTDQLLASFAVSSSLINEFEIGKQLYVEIAGRASTMGTVYSIGVVTEAQSGTVLVKLLINNQKQEIRAGESCLLNI